MSKTATGEPRKPQYLTAESFNIPNKIQKPKQEGGKGKSYFQITYSFTNEQKQKYANPEITEIDGVTIAYDPRPYVPDAYRSALGNNPTMADLINLGQRVSDISLSVPLDRLDFWEDPQTDTEHLAVFDRILGAQLDDLTAKNWSYLRKVCTNKSLDSSKPSIQEIQTFKINTGPLKKIQEDEDRGIEEHYDLRFPLRYKWDKVANKWDYSNFDLTFVINGDNYDKTTGEKKPVNITKKFTPHTIAKYMPAGTVANLMLALPSRNDYSIAGGKREYIVKGIWITKKGESRGRKMPTTFGGKDLSNIAEDDSESEEEKTETTPEEEDEDLVIKKTTVPPTPPTTTSSNGDAESDDEESGSKKEEEEEEEEEEDETED